MTIQTNATYFDYSKYNTYKKCPLNYKWSYVDRKQPKTPPNYYYAFQGSVIQKLFELFYNEKWYLKRDKCREYMFHRAPEIFEDVLRYNTIDWHSKIAKKSKQIIYQEFLDNISKGLDVIKQYKLLGDVAQSEKKLQSFFDDNKYVILLSKMDFLIKNQDGMQILDGKCTSNKSGYMKDPSQLFFYAIIYKNRYGKYPDKLGYWFWRDSEIRYVDIDETKITELKEKIKETLWNIHKKKFDATPSYGSCLFCNYKDECDFRTRQIAEKRLEKEGVVNQKDIDLFL